MAMFANDACGAPIPFQMCLPWMFFDGKLFHANLIRVSKARNVLDLCGGRIDIVNQVERMRAAIMEGLMPPNNAAAAASSVQQQQWHDNGGQFQGIRELDRMFGYKGNQKAKNRGGKKNKKVSNAKQKMTVCSTPFLVSCT